MKEAGKQTVGTTPIDTHNFTRSAVALSAWNTTLNTSIIPAIYGNNCAMVAIMRLVLECVRIATNLLVK